MRRTLHRHCRPGSVSFSIPTVTLQLPASAHSIPFHPAHAHTHTHSDRHTQHAAFSAHGEEGQQQSGCVLERGRGDGRERRVCAALLQGSTAAGS